MPLYHAELRPAWRNYWVWLTLAGVLLLMSLGASLGESESNEELGSHIWFYAGLGVFAVVIIKRYLWKFTVDSNRISRHYGIISRNQQSVRIKDIRSIELNQNLFQRIFGIGDLSFYSAGTDKAEVKFFGITRPSEWRDKIDNATDQSKSANE